MYHMVTLVSNTMLYTWKFPKAHLKHSTRPAQKCEVIDELIISISVIIPQCILMLNQHVVHLKYIQSYFSTISQECWEKRGKEKKTLLPDFKVNRCYILDWDYSPSSPVGPSAIVHMIFI